MRSPPITYRNRYTDTVETETVYGERWLRWTYETVPGRFLLETVIKRAFFSRLYGWWANRSWSRRKIDPFIRTYGIDVAEMAEDPDKFRTFNDFFSRRLKPGARPIAAGDERIVSPADGRHLAFPDIDTADGFFVKGQVFSLREFLEDDYLWSLYRGGSMLLSRLCPVDYHRFHFPSGGIPGPSRLIPGDFYSVNPYALRRRFDYLAQNRRMCSVLETERIGRVLYCEIGATCVGGIRHTYEPGKPVEKGAEKGCFRFGGSSVVLLFERGRIRFTDDLLEESACYRETYVRMGDVVAEVAE